MTITLSMRWRLALAYSCVLFIVVLLLGVATYVSAARTMSALVDRELSTRLAGLDDHLTRHVGRMPWSTLGPSLQEHPAFQPDLLRIEEVGGSLRFEGRGLAGPLSVQYDGQPSEHTITHGGRSLRLVSVRREFGGRQYDLALATDVLIPSALIDRLGTLLLILVPSVVLVAAWVGYWISGRALAPVASIIQSAKAITADTLETRVAVPPTGDEIAALAETTNEMLDRIDDGVKRMKRFTADASHELRTPVAIIRASAEVALMAPSEPRMLVDALERIQLEAERASVMLEDLLQLARADAGGEPTRLQPIDLAATMARAVSDVASLARAKGLQLHRQAIGTAWVHGDAERLVRLWRILLDNAVKYTQAGHITVHCDVADDGRARCTITDTGIGISPEHVPRLCERFYRVDGARSRHTGGAGLGLAIADQIVRQHDATMTVESRVGEGSSFTVTFQHSRLVPLPHQDVLSRIA